MSTACVILLLGILKEARAVPPKLESTQHDRHVGVTLETVIEFNETDHVEDLRFLDNVQNFIGQVKTIMTQSKTNLRRDFDTDTVQKFTDFVRQAIKILNKYTDKDIEHFFSIFNDEIRNYHYRGCKFYELADNYDMRKTIARQLDVFKKLPPPEKRVKITYLSNVLKNKNKKNEKDLIDFINSLYEKDCVQNYKDFLSKIDGYRKMKKEKDLQKIIKDGLRTVIFGHYSKLHRNARMALKSKIDQYWSILQNKSEIEYKVMPITSEPKNETSETSSESENEEPKSSYNIKHKIKKIDNNEIESNQASEANFDKENTKKLKYMDEIQVVKYSSQNYPKLRTNAKKVTRTFVTLYPKLEKLKPNNMLESYEINYSNMRSDYEEKGYAYDQDDATKKKYEIDNLIIEPTERNNKHTNTQPKQYMREKSSEEKISYADPNQILHHRVKLNNNELEPLLSEEKTRFKKVTSRTKPMTFSINLQSPQHDSEKGIKPDTLQSNRRSLKQSKHMKTILKTKNKTTQNIKPRSRLSEDEVLHRIKNLESELKAVKILLLEDIETVRELNDKVRRQHGTQGDVKLKHSKVNNLKNVVNREDSTENDEFVRDFIIQRLKYTTKSTGKATTNNASVFNKSFKTGVRRKPAPGVKSRSTTADDVNVITEDIIRNVEIENDNLRFLHRHQDNIT